MNQYIRLVFRISISSLFIYFLLKKMDITNIINALKQFKAIHIAAMLIGMSVSLTTTYLSLIVLLNIKNAGTNWHFIRSYLVSMALGALSPARLGDFSFAYFVREIMPPGRSIAILFVNKIITITLAMSISIVGAAFLFYADYKYYIIGGWVILACIMLVSIKYAGKCIMGIRRIKKIDFLNEFGKAIKVIVMESKRRIAASYAIMFVKFCIDASLAFFLLQSFGVEVTFWFSLFVSCASLLISLVPITLNGLGLRETALAYIFAYAKLDPGKGVAVFFAIVISYYLLIALIPLLIIRVEKEK